MLIERAASMRKLTIVLIILLLSLLAACGQSENTDNETSGEPDTATPIEADLNVPEQADKNESITFTVTVTQDGEAVSDASEVAFEIWEDGNEGESEMIEADNDGDGQYTVEKSFDQDGVYHVQSHVTARTMHTMPVKEITVGNPENAGESNGESHSHSQVAIDFQQPDTISAGSEASFTVDVLNEETPLEEGSVTLEIQQEDVDQHNWVDLTENAAGSYEGTTTFDNSGSYQITVHVEKEDVGIHEHENFTVEVAD